MKGFFTPFRIRLLAVILFVTPLGFASKFYSGTMRGWINDSLGGVLYEIFWCLIAAFSLPKAKPSTVALGVFAMTGILEVLQLWHPVFLETIRNYFLGRTLIGTSFAWLDFPHYAAGCAIGWFLLNRLKK